MQLAHLIDVCVHMDLPVQAQVCLAVKCVWVQTVQIAGVDRVFKSLEVDVLHGSIN